LKAAPHPCGETKPKRPPTKPSTIEEEAQKQQRATYALIVRSDVVDDVELREIDMPRNAAPQKNFRSGY